MADLDLTGVPLDQASRKFCDWLKKECASWGLNPEVEVGLHEHEEDGDMGRCWKVSCEAGPDEWARAMQAGKSLYYVHSEGTHTECEVVFDSEEYLLWACYGWELTFYAWE